jgi:hypothetical protein
MPSTARLDSQPGAQAIRRELRALLTEIPTLHEMTLMDDLPTAGPATVQWLNAEGLLGGEGDAIGTGSSSAPVASSAGEGRDQMLERALAEVRTGQASKAIDRIKRALDRENSERFIRQTQRRTDAGGGARRGGCAILKQLLARVTRAARVVESGPLVAELMVPHRSYSKSNTEPKVRRISIPHLPAGSSGADAGSDSGEGGQWRG